ncbi:MULTISPECIES: hypothetical protein [Nocardia]|uniref:hypothetical protein n=1 Tax=Nocardia TaxID=1817 RepID=UPI001892D4DD|nr:MULTISPECIES: hypothetical protein [Nocardia]MBF6170279.1 hypothetical protein [Nocardia blacklockiae]
MTAATVLAYKQMPADVVEPVMQLINWLLWVVLLFCLAWMIISAGRLWSAMRDDMAVNDASHGIVMSLIGAVVASSASAIALTLLPT